MKLKEIDRIQAIINEAKELKSDIETLERAIVKFPAVGTLTIDFAHDSPDAKAFGISYLEFGAKLSDRFQFVPCLARLLADHDATQRSAKSGELESK